MTNSAKACLCNSVVLLLEIAQTLLLCGLVLWASTRINVAPSHVRKEVQTLSALHVQSMLDVNRRLENLKETLEAHNARHDLDQGGPGIGQVGLDEN